MEHEKLDYVEFAAENLEATKTFFHSVFGWHFTDYGEDYTAFDFQGLMGGFYRAELCSRACRGGALLVFYSRELEETYDKVKKGKGEINKKIFEFPGGRRFHFIEPSGNEFAVWSDK